MKIVYCIAGTYNSGGMERVLANKANYLAVHGYEVVIITTDQRGKQPFFDLDRRIRCHDLGINYEENNGKSFQTMETSKETVGMPEADKCGYCGLHVLQ